MSRLWLDAHVLLRFITGEPAELAERSSRLLRRAEEGEVTLYLSELTLAEVVWVLRSFYGHSIEQIADVLVRLVSAPGIAVDNRDRTIQALELARDQNVDYIDAVLALQAAANDETVVTFDKTDFKRLPVRWILPDEFPRSP